MSIEVIQQRLNSYQCKTVLEERNALKEITQEIALMALSKAGFFKIAEFHGGTALRILHSLQRFSEDLDFALLTPNPHFDLNIYLNQMAENFEAYGYGIQISDRSEVQKQFLKIDSIGKLFTLKYPFKRDDKKIKIKFEVDTNPPKGATTEIKFLNFPLAFSVLAKDLSSSFAGKLHALLCRPYEKGRDWYDFIWYVTYKIPINFLLFSHSLCQQGPWQGQSISINPTWLINQLTQKIESLNWENIKKDVQPLLKSNEVYSLQTWNKDFFLAQLKILEKYLN